MQPKAITWSQATGYTETFFLDGKQGIVQAIIPKGISAENIYFEVAKGGYNETQKAEAEAAGFARTANISGGAVALGTVSTATDRVRNLQYNEVSPAGVRAWCRIYINPAAYAADQTFTIFAG